MSANAQLRLGQSVMRKLANCSITVQGGAGPIPGILSSLPVEPVLGEARAQAQDIQVRVNRADVLGLGVPLRENALLSIETTLPHEGSYRVAADASDLPNTAHLILPLKKVR